MASSGRRWWAMPNFYGTYTPRMDDKGRVTLPARYRDAFAGGAMIVRGQDHCLYVLTPEGFEEFAAAVITGAGLRMEIWDAEQWTAYEARQEAAYADPERGLLDT